MSDDGAVATECACPRLRARDCIRVRTGRDLREMLGAETGDAEEVCECSCQAALLAHGATLAPWQPRAFETGGVVNKTCCKNGCDAKEHEVNSYTNQPHLLICAPHMAALARATHPAAEDQFIAKARLDAAIHSGDVERADMCARQYMVAEAKAIAAIDAWCATPDTVAVTE